MVFDFPKDLCVAYLASFLCLINPRANWLELIFCNCDLVRFSEVQGVCPGRRAPEPNQCAYFSIQPEIDVFVVVSAVGEIFTREYF
jgi:hypothetical protein